MIRTTHLGMDSFTYSELIRAQGLFGRDQLSPILVAIRSEITRRDIEFTELQYEARAAWQRSNRRYHPLPNDADLIKFNHWNNQ